MYPDPFSVTKYVGRHDWVSVNLATVEANIMRRLVINAWRQTAPTRLVFENDTGKSDPADRGSDLPT